MEHIKKNLKRLEQRTAQTVLRVEKTEVLAEVEELGHRVDVMLRALHETRAKLVDGLRTKGGTHFLLNHINHLHKSSIGGGDNAEKRKKKVEEWALASVLLAQARQLGQDGEGSLLSHVMGLYGSGLDHILDELVKCERDIEERVLPSLGKFSEEEKSIKAMKEKLSRAVLDMDSAKRRLQAAKENERVEHVQDELDAAAAKVENWKDQLIVELHTLSGKEVQMGQIYYVAAEIQLDYFRTAAATLERLLPDMADRIAAYPRRPVFGCHLEEHLRYSGRQIALVLEVCCAALTELGLRDEGLFRISGNALKVRKLKAALDAGTVDLSDYDKDPHSIAGSLKAYLRELPDPLMTHNLYGEWKTAAALDPEARLPAIAACLAQLPASNRLNLAYLIKFLVKVVERERENKMSAGNLAIVFGPNLIWMGEDQGDSFLGTRLVETLILNANYFFPQDVRFTSSLIGSLHDRSGGFATGTGLIVSAYSSSVSPTADDARPTNHDARPNHRNHSLSPQPTSTNSSSRAVDRHPSAQKRPKAPAPPPPPNFGGRGGMGGLYPSLPRSSDLAEFPSNPPSKSSSADDSLNEYGMEEPPQISIEGSLGTLSSGYSSTRAGDRRPINSFAAPESLEDVRKVDDLLEGARMTQSVTQSIPLGKPSIPPNPPRGHRKTGSFDQYSQGRNSVIKNELEEKFSSLSRARAAAAEEAEEDGIRSREGSGRAREGSSRSAEGSGTPPPVSLFQRGSGERRGSGEDEETPTRPPPPSKTALERHSGPVHRHSLVLDVNPGAQGPPEPFPRKTLNVGLPPRTSTLISVEGSEGSGRASSPDKPKPPLPAKPKLPEMTHL